MKKDLRAVTGITGSTNLRAWDYIWCQRLLAGLDMRYRQKVRMEVIQDFALYLKIMIIT